MTGVRAIPLRRSLRQLRDEIRAEVAELKVMRDSINIAVEEMRQSAPITTNECELIIGHLGDLVLRYARQADQLRAATDPLADAAEIFDSNGKFIGNANGACLCNFITGEDLMKAVKARNAA